MDWKIYQQAMEKLSIYSPHSLVYVLVHKMDKIQSDMKRSVGLPLVFNIEIGFLHRKGEIHVQRKADSSFWNIHLG